MAETIRNGIRQPKIKTIINQAPRVTVGSLVCKAPEGKQIKTCTFNIKVGDDKRKESIEGRGVVKHSPGPSNTLTRPILEYPKMDFKLIRPKNETFSNAATTRTQTFANE
jgi:hypothetical protein